MGRRSQSADIVSTSWKGPTLAALRTKGKYLVQSKRRHHHGFRAVAHTPPRSLVRRASPHAMLFLAREVETWPWHTRGRIRDRGRRISRHSSDLSPIQVGQ